MHDICTYHVLVRGHVDESAFNATSPLQVTVVRVDADKGHPPAADKEHAWDATLFAVCADQSGLIGLLRHLHGQGFVISSVYRER
jgi:hypothetical protein